MQDFTTEDGFKHTFQENYSRLFNLACKILNDDNAAADIVQDVFLKLWTNRKSIQIRSGLKPYLNRSVINACLNELEKRKKTNLPGQLPQVIISPEDRPDHDLLRKQLNRAITALPSRMQVVFTLSRFEGLSNQEIADYLSISKKTVENQLGKALHKLREAIK